MVKNDLHDGVNTGFNTYGQHNEPTYTYICGKPTPAQVSPEMGSLLPE